MGDEEGEKTALTVRLPDELLEAARMLAGVKGQSLNRFVSDAVRAQVRADAGTPELRTSLLSRLEAAARDAS